MLSFSEITELKNILKQKFGADLHFHDVCPKPYFTLDKSAKEIQEAIGAFLSARHMCAAYSSDGLHFTIERDN